MWVCRRCGKEYPDATAGAFCPLDGAPLFDPADGDEPTEFSSTEISTVDSQGVAGSAVITPGSAAPALRPSEEIPAGTLIGEYRIDGVLGEGGMGAVYAARHPVIGKRAAVKVLHRKLCTSDESVERFILEARSVNQIGHPNIVDIFSFGTLADGRSYFVMEWLLGESLGTRLRQGRLPLAETVEILDAVAKALVAAHDAGIIHRDLKPDNVFLETVKGDRPQVKLLDFGIAKLHGEADTRIERTATGVVMGTPLYISPEQARGVQVDARTDIYALGVMAYEMFAGKPPFSGDSAVEVMHMHMTATPASVRSLAPEVPRDLDALVIAMLAKDPALRPTLSDVRDRLNLARLRASAVSLPAMEPAEPRRPRFKLRAALLAAFVAAFVVVFVAIRATRDGDPPPPPDRAQVPPAPPAPLVTPPLAPPAPPPSTPARDLGTLAIRAMPADAVVTVDGKPVQGSGGVYRIEVGPGAHQVAATARGWRAAKQRVTVTVGETVNMELALVKRAAGTAKQPVDVNAIPDPFKKTP